MPCRPPKKHSTHGPVTLLHLHYYIVKFIFRIGSPALYHVSAQVDAKDGDSSQRKRNTGNDEEEERGDLRDVAGQCVSDGLLQVIEYETTCEHK